MSSAHRCLRVRHLRAIIYKILSHSSFLPSTVSILLEFAGGSSFVASYLTSPECSALFRLLAVFDGCGSLPRADHPHTLYTIFTRICISPVLATVVVMAHSSRGSPYMCSNGLDTTRDVFAVINQINMVPENQGAWSLRC